MAGVITANKVLRSHLRVHRSGRGNQNTNICEQGEGVMSVQAFT